MKKLADKTDDSSKRPLSINYTRSGVLLVLHSQTEARLIQSGLAGAFRVDWVTRLQDALERLGRSDIDVVLLDLTLADAQGLAVFDQVFEAAPNALILILTEASDEAVAREAMQRGAQDYFLNDHIDTYWLSRSLRYLIESKAARDALNNSEARFRAMSDASPLGIFVSDADGECVYTNAAYQRISGLSFEQALGTSWRTAIHPEDRKRVIADWYAAAHNDVPMRTEFRFQQEDGSVVWTRVNSAAMQDGMQPHGHVKTVEDITERRLVESGLRVAEEALFEEKERAQVTLNSIGDAVLVTDLAGNVTYLNLEAEVMTGWSREEALGRPLAEIFKIIEGSTRQTAANPAQHALKEDRTVGLAETAC